MQNSNFKFRMSYTMFQTIIFEQSFYERSVEARDHSFSSATARQKFPSLSHPHRARTHTTRTPLYPPPRDSIALLLLSAPGTCAMAFKPNVLSNCVPVVVRSPYPPFQIRPRQASKSHRHFVFQDGWDLRGATVGTPI